MQDSLLPSVPNKLINSPPSHWEQNIFHKEHINSYGQWYLCILCVIRHSSGLWRGDSLSHLRTWCLIDLRTGLWSCNWENRGYGSQLYTAGIGIEKITVSVAALISIVISRLKGTVRVLKTIISAEADSLSELAELAGALVCLLLVSVGW